MSDMTLGQLVTRLAGHSRWGTEDTVVRATTPHGSYTFEIDYTCYDGNGNSVVMLHLREVPTMTMDHSVIRNSVDDDWPTALIHVSASVKTALEEVTDKLRVARARNRESNRLFEESQDVAAIAVAEVKRLRKFIAEEFIMEMEGTP